MNTTIKLSLHVLFLVAVAIYAQYVNYTKSQPELMHTLLKNQRDLTLSIANINEKELADLDESTQIRRNYRFLSKKLAEIPQITTNFQLFIDSCRQIIQVGETDIDENMATLLYHQKNHALLKMRMLVDSLAKTDAAGWQISSERLARMNTMFDGLANQPINQEYFSIPITDKYEKLAFLEALNLDIQNMALMSIFFISDNIYMRRDKGFSSFEVLSNSNKTYILPNEEYNTTLSIGNCCNFIKAVFVVNGDTIRGDDSGRQIYKHRPQKAGLQQYTVECFFENPILDIPSKAIGTFYYEVGVPNTQIITSVRKLAPVPTLAELRGGDIAREKLRLPITLQAEDERETVLSFTLWHLQKGKEPRAYQIKSDKIPAYILAKIQAGDQLQFVDIRARNQNNLPTMAFIVSD